MNDWIEFDPYSMPNAMKEGKKRTKTITGYLIVPKGGFKINSTTLFFNLKDVEAFAFDKSRIQSVAFEVEVEIEN